MVKLSSVNNFQLTFGTLFYVLPCTVRTSLLQKLCTMNGRADKLNKLLNEMEIKSLLVRERYYRDTCQWENLRQCYHADPTKTLIDISWYVLKLLHILSPQRINLTASG